MQLIFSFYVNLIVDSSQIGALCCPDGSKSNWTGITLLTSFLSRDTALVLLMHLPATLNRNRSSQGMAVSHSSMPGQPRPQSSHLFLTTWPALSTSVAHHPAPLAESTLVQEL